MLEHVEIARQGDHRILISRYTWWGTLDVLALVSLILVASAGPVIGIHPADSNIQALKAYHCDQIHCLPDVVMQWLR